MTINIERDFYYCVQAEHLAGAKDAVAVLVTLKVLTLPSSEFLATFTEFPIITLLLTDSLVAG